MAKPKLVISIIEFDPDAIASAMKLNSGQIIAALKDGRGAWPFSELWGERLFEFVKHANTNAPSSDGAVALEQLRNVNVSVEALTGSGVRFQQSKFQGSRRSASKEDLIASVEACDRVVVVDVTDFPIVRFVPLDGTRLVSAAHRDQLTTSGWAKSRFYSWLADTYELSEVKLQI